MGYIYLVKNKVNGKVYVGQTKTPVKFRWNQHVKATRGNRKAYFYRAIRKYGPEAFRVSTLHTCNSPKRLDVLEKREIRRFHSTDNKCGYNIRDGGQGGGNGGGWKLSEEICKKRKDRRKWHFSPESKRKLSLAHKGKVLSIEHRLHLSQANHKRYADPRERQKMSRCGKENGFFGRKHSRESIEKMSNLAKARTGEKNGFFGRTHTLEVRQKIALAQTGRIKSRNTCLLISLKNKGKKRTPEQRANYSVAAKKRWADGGCSSFNL